MFYLTSFGAKDFLPSLFGEGFPALSRSFFTEPQVNESENEIALTLDLPGFEKGNISILRENNIIAVSATRERKTNKGIDTRSYEQRFQLPDSVNLETIDAEYKDGVLTIVAPKKPETKPIKVTVR